MSIQPAIRINSYAETLIKVMDALKPKQCFEWGPGTSTLIMCEFPSVEHVESVEHDKYWYERSKDIHPKAYIVFDDDVRTYPFIYGTMNYDLIFVDGRLRNICLGEAKRRGKVIMLHDCEREKYRPMVEAFQYRFITGSGNTATLTDDKDIAKVLEKKLEKELVPYATIEEPHPVL